MTGATTNSPNPLPSRGRGFTLVELLVVLGVVALLIGLLLPVLGRARASARATACLARLHDIGVGIHAYAAGNHGVMIRAGGQVNPLDPDDLLPWPIMSRPDLVEYHDVTVFDKGYIEMASAAGNRDTFRCPDFPSPTAPIHYVMNATAFPHGEADKTLYNEDVPIRRLTNIGRIRRASEAAMLLEYLWRDDPFEELGPARRGQYVFAMEFRHIGALPGLAGVGVTSVAPKRHGDKANLLMFDGSGQRQDMMRLRGLDLDDGIRGDGPSLKW